MKLYRVEDDIDPYGFPNSIYKIITFKVYKETKKGYWIDKERSPGGFKCRFKKRWVPKEGKNIYAWTTKEKALNNYRIRKEYQKKHLKRQLKDTEDRLRQVNQVKQNDLGDI